MEYATECFNSNNNSSSSGDYSLVDVFYRKKYSANNYIKFLLNIQDAHLAEAPIFPRPLLVDIDISEPIENKEDGVKELYDDAVVKDVAMSYTEALNDALEKLPEKYYIIYLCKPPRIVKTKSGKWIIKHGFHLHFLNILLGKKDSKIIHTRAKNITEYGEYIDDVSSTPWLLYGSTKSPSDLPYKISYAIIIENDDYIIEKNYRKLYNGHKICGIELNSIKENIDTLILSTRLGTTFTLASLYKVKNEIHDEIRENLDVNNPPSNTVFNFELPTNRSTSRDDSNILYQSEQDGDEKKNGLKNFPYVSSKNIMRLVMELDIQRTIEYSKWVQVCMILCTISKERSNDPEVDWKELFHMFSRRYLEAYDEQACEQKWNSIVRQNCSNPVGFGTLIKLAKEDGLIKRNRDICFDFNPCFIPVNDIDIAEAIKEYVPKMFVTHKDHGCWTFKETTWEEVRDWEDAFAKYTGEWLTIYDRRIKENIKLEQIEEEKLEMQKQLSTLVKKLRNHSSLNNVKKSIFDIFHCSDIEKLFQQQTRYIAFNNKVFDVESWEFVEPKPEFYIKDRFIHDYIPWEEHNYENKEFVRDFMKKIFPDKELRKYMKKECAVFMLGRNVFKQFNVWTGIGNNGKSVFIRLLESVFTKMVMKAPKSIIMNTQQKQGGANPELFRLRSAKLAIIDEITDNDVLDPGSIKNITGDDALYGRDLYQKADYVSEIQPFFHPIAIMNSVPYIKRADEATMNRLRVIPFESIFTLENFNDYIKTHPNIDKNRLIKADPNVKDKLKVKANVFLSYFVKQLLKCNSLEEFASNENVPRKAREALEKFKRQQNIIKKFMDENYIIDNNPESENYIRIQNIMREYNASKGAVQLSLTEITDLLKNYSQTVSGISITDTGFVKGISRLER